MIFVLNLCLIQTLHSVLPIPHIVIQVIHLSSAAAPWCLYAWRVLLIPGEDKRNNYVSWVVIFLYGRFPHWSLYYLISSSGFITRHQHVSVIRGYPWHSGKLTSTWDSGQLQYREAQVERGVWWSMMKGLIIRREVSPRRSLLIKYQHLPVIYILDKFEQNQGYLYNSILTSSRIL